MPVNEKKDENKVCLFPAKAKIIHLVMIPVDYEERSLS